MSLDVMSLQSRDVLLDMTSTFARKKHFFEVSRSITRVDVSEDLSTTRHVIVLSFDVAVTTGTY